MIWHALFFLFTFWVWVLNNCSFSKACIFCTLWLPSHTWLLKESQRNISLWEIAALWSTNERFRDLWSQRAKSGLETPSSGCVLCSSLHYQIELSVCWNWKGAKGDSGFRQRFFSSGSESREFSLTVLAQKRGQAGRLLQSSQCFSIRNDRCPLPPSGTLAIVWRVLVVMTRGNAIGI